LPYKKTIENSLFKFSFEGDFIPKFDCFSSLFRAGVQAHFGPPALVVATDVTQTSHFTTTHAWGQKSPGMLPFQEKD